MANNVWAVYFSATGTTEKTVKCIADAAAEALGANRKNFDFTLPDARKKTLSMGPDDVVVFGTPVIAGRVPNVLLKYLDTVKGGGAMAIPVVSYGNRDYDDALIELRDILAADGFKPFAAGAFIGEHSFSRVLAKDRPDADDLAIATRLGKTAAQKLISGEKYEGPVFVKGTEKPYRPYYMPRDRKGTPVDIRKVKPVTSDECIDCKTCAKVCPLGSISFDDVREFTGICMKCCACVKKCPKGAKYYDDENYLYHKKELEEGFARRAEPETFIG